MIYVNIPKNRLKIDDENMAKNETYLSTQIRAEKMSFRSIINV